MSKVALAKAVKNGQANRIEGMGDDGGEGAAGVIKTEHTNLRIPAPKMVLLTQSIRGTGPFVQARFSEKARGTMKDKMMAGSTAKKGGPRAARDFDEDFKQSVYLGPDGQHGIPASAFRAAAISACRIVGFKMTQAKLGFFCEADFFDPRDGTPLVAIQGTPEPLILPVRNATGVADIRCRAMWKEWTATIRVRFDSDMFTDADVANLLIRVGMQVGVGEGRPDSKKSAGMGWGTFALEGKSLMRVLSPQELGFNL